MRGDTSAPAKPGRPRAAVVLCSALALAGASLHGFALAAGQEPDSEGEEPVRLEVVLVTAEKRATKLQETPIAITALAGDTLERTRALSLADIQMSVPGLVVSSNAAFVQPYIRGIGNEILGGLNDAAVATLLDGVHEPRAPGLLMDFHDIERIEVLRGPQGALYGRNATAGVINVITKQPGSTTDGLVSVGVGNYNARRASAAATLPLSDRLAIRAAGFIERRAGFQRNLLDGNDADDRNVAGGRLTARLQPDDHWTLIFSGDYTNDRSRSVGGREISGSAQLAPALAFGGVTGSGFFDINIDAPPTSRNRNGGVRFSAEWTQDEMTLTSLSAWRHNRYWLVVDEDLTQLPAVTLDPGLTHSNSYSEELRFAARAGRLRYAIGGYFFREEIRDLFNLQLTPAFAPGPLIYDAHGRTSAYALFANGEYSLQERLSISLGARYSTDIRSASSDDTLFGTPFAPDPRRERWSSLAPRLGLNWQLASDTLLYAGIAKGFKSGGINTLSPSFESYGPETLWSYEVGLKSDWLDSRVRSNLAAFYYDYRDLQVVTFAPTGSVIGNAASAHARGVEAELTAVPNEHVEIGANLAWLNAGFAEYRSNGAGGPAVYDGNKLPRAPAWAAQFYAQYRIRLLAGSLNLRTEYSRRDRTYFTPANDRLTSQGPVTLWNASLQYQLRNGKTSIDAWTRNLSNHKSLQLITSNPGITGVAGLPAPPRTFGVSLAQRF